MIKAVFIDYTGTMVQEADENIKKLVGIFITHSNLKDTQEVMRICWGMIKQSEWEDYLDTFIDTDELVDRILAYCVEHYGLSADLELMHGLWRNSWIHAPLYPDAEAFFRTCSLPIYVVSNDNLAYLQESMREKGLSPAGIISAEAVRACKPHIEMLQEALRVSGVRPEEAVLIGDSEQSDVACALQAGITPILLDRSGKLTRSDIRVIRSLTELEF